MRFGRFEFLVASEIPFTFAKEQYFEEFVQKYVQPSYRSVSRNIVRSDCINLFHTMKDNLGNQFHDFDGIICFTSDCWFGCSHNGYVCIIAHYICICE